MRPAVGGRRQARQHAPQAQGFVAELIVALKAYGPMLDPGVTRQLRPQHAK